MKTLIVTRKIELAVIGTPEEKNKAWAFLRKLDREVWQAANKIISDQWFYNTFEQKLLSPDIEKIAASDQIIEQAYQALKLAADDKKKIKEIEKVIDNAKKTKNALLKEARVQARLELKKFFEVSTPQLSYRMIAEEYKSWGSNVYDALCGKINADFANDYIDVLQGKRSLRNYKRGMPIPVRATGLRFVKEEENIYLNWIQGIKFILVFGRDKSSRRAEMERLLSGEYDYGDSSIQIVDKKIFLLLALKHPLKSTALNPEQKLKVEAGIRVPVRCIDPTTGEVALFGQASEIVRKRIQFQSRYKELQKSLRDTVGGHGRDKKLQALDKLKKAERNWIRTYNHVLSKNVITMCQKLNTGTILLEDIKELPKDEEEKKFYARNWAGFELKTMIMQKAKAENIQVEAFSSSEQDNVL